MRISRPQASPFMVTLGPPGPPFAAIAPCLSLLLLLLVTPALAPPASAATDSAAPVVEAQIRQVIEAQLAAFRRDDGGAAFSDASPTVQRLFGTAERFMRMVRGGYQAVYRPRRYRFLELLLEGSQPVQRVLFVGPDGVTVIALYLMELQPSGVWRINGVFMDAPSRFST